MKNFIRICVFCFAATAAFGCTEGAGVTGNGCPPTDPCGNGAIDEGEMCDPGNGLLGVDMVLAGMSCQLLTNRPGQLACNCRCQYDMSMCQAGNGQGGNGG